MSAKEILKKDYGEDADYIYDEIRAEVDEALVNGSYDDVEQVLIDYGFEMDYVFEFI